MAAADVSPVIDISVACEAWTDALGDGIDPLIERAVQAALAEAASSEPVSVPADTEVSVVLCDDAFIRDLNERWRGKPHATNVLSFPSATQARALTLGDIIVAFETSASEAAERAVPLADYLTHLIVHGTFHLLGFDHESDPDAERMEGIESRTLSVLGIESPYEGRVDADLRSAP